MSNAKGKIAVQHMLAYLQDNYTTVGVRFFANDSHHTTGKIYTLMLKAKCVICFLKLSVNKHARIMLLTSSPVLKAM